MAKITDFIISKVRVKLMRIFLLSPQSMYYVRELTRKTKEEINAVRRELGHLQQIGLLKSSRHANRLYYTLSPQYKLVPELTSIFAKTSPVAKLILRSKPKLGDIKYCFVSLSIIQGLERQPDDIDIMFIGDVVMPEITNLVFALEQKLKTEINYSCMTLDEFGYRKTHQDSFIYKALIMPKIVLVGDEKSLIA
jgi:hypothetical protein